MPLTVSESAGASRSFFCVWGGVVSLFLFIVCWQPSISHLPHSEEVF